MYPAVTVDDRCEARVRAGHVWVYESDIKDVSVTPENGALCDVFSRRGRYLGTGFFNAASKIRVRILSTNANDRFDELFWERRVRYAIEYRRTVMASAEDFLCCRLIFGEADQFPGLTVDRFGDVLVTETLSLGVELRKDIIFPAIVRVLAEMGVPVKALYERNNVAIRKLEGMEETVGFYPCDGLDEHPAMTEARICENGIYYNVDFINGQKTGFFLDQKYNRLAAAKLARGRTVLDCFTHTGSFALNAAKTGAAHVDAVDISADAIAM
ncbi:MAG: class I SAM-dependent rRNA methyltransferase, partial [Clostridia bacterium]|nr:class I SAM-dependent rRNA methyltransferase [Clostridia bacterium]